MKRFCEVNDHESLVNNNERAKQLVKHGKVEQWAPALEVVLDHELLCFQDSIRWYDCCAKEKLQKLCFLSREIPEAGDVVKDLIKPLNENIILFWQNIIVSGDEVSAHQLLAFQSHLLNKKIANLRDQLTAVAVTQEELRTSIERRNMTTAVLFMEAFLIVQISAVAKLLQDIWHCIVLKWKQHRRHHHAIIHHLASVHVLFKVADSFKLFLDNLLSLAHSMERFRNDVSCHRVSDVVGEEHGSQGVQFYNFLIRQSILHDFIKLCESCFNSMDRIMVVLQQPGKYVCSVLLSGSLYNRLQLCIQGPQSLLDHLRLRWFRWTSRNHLGYSAACEVLRVKSQFEDDNTRLVARSFARMAVNEFEAMSDHVCKHSILREVHEQFGLCYLELSRDLCGNEKAMNFFHRSLFCFNKAWIIRKWIVFVSDIGGKDINKFKLLQRQRRNIAQFYLRYGQILFNYGRCIINLFSMGRNGTYRELILCAIERLIEEVSTMLDPIFAELFAGYESKSNEISYNHANQLSSYALQLAKCRFKLTAVMKDHINNTLASNGDFHHAIQSLLVKTVHQSSCGYAKVLQLSSAWNCRSLRWKWSSYRYFVDSSAPACLEPVIAAIVTESSKIALFYNRISPQHSALLDTVVLDTKQYPHDRCVMVSATKEALFKMWSYSLIGDEKNSVKVRSCLADLVSIYHQNHLLTEKYQQLHLLLLQCCNTPAVEFSNVAKSFAISINDNKVLMELFFDQLISHFVLSKEWSAFFTSISVDSDSDDLVEQVIDFFNRHAAHWSSHLPILEGISWLPSLCIQILSSFASAVDAWISLLVSVIEIFLQPNLGLNHQLGVCNAISTACACLTNDYFIHTANVLRPFRMNVPQANEDAKENQLLTMKENELSIKASLNSWKFNTANYPGKISVFTMEQSKM